MNTARQARKAVRSLLFAYPPLYELLTSEKRYLLMYRLHLLHEPCFGSIPLLLDREDPLILDVGGNIGQSVLSIKVAAPGARVMSFEPNPVPRRTLERLVDLFPDLTVQPFGLGVEGDEKALYVPVYRGKVMSGLASFDLHEASSWISPRTVYGFDPARLRVESYPLEIRRLDDLGLEPDMMKLDVQGYEEPVVRGGLETIRRSRPVIMAETPSAGLRALLAEEGYRALEFEGRGRRGQLIASTGRQVNQIFAPA